MIFSPLSVWMVLSMALNGARGNTKFQLTSALHLPPDTAAQSFGIESLIEKLNVIYKKNKNYYHYQL